MTVSVTYANGEFLGMVNGGGTWAGGSMDVDTTDVDLILVSVGSNSEGLEVEPEAYMDGLRMQKVGMYTSMYEGSEFINTSYIFVGSPIGGGIKTITVGAKYWIGLIAYQVVCLRSTNGQIGVVMSDNGSGYTRNYEVSGVRQGNACLAFLYTFYADPTSLSVPPEWTVETHCSGQYYDEEEVPGPFVHGWSIFNGEALDGPVTVENTGAWAHMSFHGIEIIERGPPVDTPVVTASDVIQFEVMSAATPKRFAYFDANGAELLFIVMSWAMPNSDTFPYLTANDVPLVQLDTPKTVEFDEGTGDAFQVSRMYVIPNPPEGQIKLQVDPNATWIGYVHLLCVGVKNTSGYALQRVTEISPSYGDGYTHTKLTLENTRRDSLLLLFGTSNWSTPTNIVEANGWPMIASAERSEDPLIPAAGYIWARDSGSWVDVDVRRDAFSFMHLIAIELSSRIVQTTEYNGNQTAGLPTTVVDANSYPNEYVDVLPNYPSPQSFALYVELWGDSPWEVPALTPDQYMIPRIPPYVDTIMLSFCKPLCTYASPSDDLQTTTGLYGAYTVSHLKEILDLLRRRHGTIKVLLSIIQSADIWRPEPYDPNGFGGMTDAHWTSFRNLVDYLEVDGVDIDYECASENLDPEYHCYYTPDGHRACYHDTELIHVIKKAREFFPREDGYIVSYSAVGNGAWGEAPYEREEGASWNSGYAYGLSRDTDARDAIDNVYVMTYDLVSAFSPKKATEAYSTLFPNSRIFLGLRIGPPDYSGTKRTGYDFMDYCNFLLKKKFGGVFMYSMFWDLVDPTHVETYSPSGEFDMVYPSAVMAASIVAHRFSLPMPDVPLLTPYGTVYQLSLDNIVVGDTYMTDLTKTFIEQIAIRDKWWRRAIVNISDYGIYSEPMSYSQFMARIDRGSPEGYGAFTPFVPGDYEFATALIKLGMYRTSEKVDLRVAIGKIRTDVPDVTEVGSTDTNTDAPVHVSLAKTFVRPPKVATGYYSGTAQGTPRITNVTATGFDLDMIDSTGTRIAGNVGWTAVGY